MKIYTKRGDKGQTDLFSGERVPKDDLLIEAYGTVDELNSLLGVVRSSLNTDLNDINKILLTIQNNLHNVCANLADTRESAQRPQIEQQHVELIENKCDYYESGLSELKNFILPGGGLSASYLHLARSVSRRAERRVISAQTKYIIDELIIKYLNRLSDLLFILARYVNQSQDHPEEKPTYE